MQKALIFPTFTDFHVRLHLKKWPYYIKNSSSGSRKETNKWRTYEAHWPYRLLNHMSWIQWGLKLRFKKKSLFSQSRPASWGEGEGDINTQTAILHGSVKKNKMWSHHGLQWIEVQLGATWVCHMNDSNGIALWWRFEKLMGYWCAKIGKQYIFQFI